MAVSDLRWAYSIGVLPLLVELLNVERLDKLGIELLTGALIVALVHQIRLQYEKMDKLARSDHLTGLLNRRAFEQLVQEECARALRSDDPLSLAYIDIDNFKCVNDSIGHAEGDRVLKHLSATMQRVTRSHVDHLCFRVGGDEFALLLPSASTLQVAAIIERISSHCVAECDTWRRYDLGISVGAVTFDKRESYVSFIKRADDLMYQIKRNKKAAKVTYIEAD